LKMKAALLHEVLHPSPQQRVEPKCGRQFR
jgi:hypothetical protein